MKGREEEIVISVPVSNTRSISPNFLYLRYNYLIGRDMIIEGTNLLLITYAFIFKYNVIILKQKYKIISPIQKHQNKLK